MNNLAVIFLSLAVTILAITSIRQSDDIQNLGTKVEQLQEIKK